MFRFQESKELIHTMPSSFASAPISYIFSCRSCGFISALIPPTVSMSPNRTQGEQSTVRLTCHARGHPPPEVTWYKDGEKVDPEPQNDNACGDLERGVYRKKASVGNHTLVICGATNLDHTGKYECRATNSEGEANATSFVTVLGKNMSSWTIFNSRVFVPFGIKMAGRACLEVWVWGEPERTPCTFWRPKHCLVPSTRANATEHCPL